MSLADKKLANPGWFSADSQLLMPWLLNPDWFTPYNLCAATSSTYSTSLHAAPRWRHSWNCLTLYCYAWASARRPHPRGALASSEARWSSRRRFRSRHQSTWQTEYYVTATTGPPASLQTPASTTFRSRHWSRGFKNHNQRWLTVVSTLNVSDSPFQHRKDQYLPQKTAL